MSRRELLYRVCIAICDPWTLPTIIVAIVIKFIFPQAFSFWWISAGLIVWAAAGFILVVWFFDEVSRHVEQ